MPAKRRLAPQKWRTSCGTFETTKVGDELAFLFPEFSESRMYRVSPDIMELPAHADQPAYDLIIGVKTMAKWGVVLDFVQEVICIDKQFVPMREIESLRDPKNLRAQFAPFLEPKSMREATNRATEILDANYEKADLTVVVHQECRHLTIDQRNELYRTLVQYEELFDGSLGDWKTEPVKLILKKGATSFHGRPFAIPHVHKATLRKEVERLVKIGVLRPQYNSEWASPSFIIAKKDKTVCALGDFREVNKRLIRAPFPLPKVKDLLEDMEGFTYATALDLNMGYFTIRLDPASQEIVTIIFPWGKYSFQRLPMGIAGAPDIFQSKMSALMEGLLYVKTYLDDLLVLTKGTFDEHLVKLRAVLKRLLDAGLRVRAPKSTFAAKEIKYFWDTS